MSDGLPAHPVPPQADDRLRWLRSPAAHAPGSGEVRLVETHMSWVLLDDLHAMKLKKPVQRPPWLDFSTAALRLQDARLELRLNRRLAPQVYLGLLALKWHAGRFSLLLTDPAAARSDEGTLDWLVLMQRLPDAWMLDHLLAAQRLRPQHIDALAGVLAPFYRQAARAPLDAGAHQARFQAESRLDAELLQRPAFGLTEAAALNRRFDAALAQLAGPLARRVLQQRIVDGHGDLRPEHVCLRTPPVVIDCLEFAAALRQVDPFEEIAFLGLECEMAGAAWVGPQLHAACAAALQDEPPAALVALYKASRALLRARLAAAHLLDAQPRTPGRWLPLAHRYLAQAATALGHIDGGAAVDAISAARPCGSA